MTTIPISTRSFDEIVQAYDLSLLRKPADWSLLDGDLARTADGDIKVGSTAYNALFRLVWLWQLNEPHFRYLLDAVNSMNSRA